MSARVLELGGEQRIISVTRDLGEWKRIQDELRTVNHAFCDMIGYSMPEVNATDFLSFTYPDPAYYSSATRKARPIRRRVPKAMPIYCQSDDLGRLARLGFSDLHPPSGSALDRSSRRRAILSLAFRRRRAEIG